MANDNKYNGFTNRETWLVNLWDADFYQEVVEEIVRDFGINDKYKMAEMMEERFDEVYGDVIEKLPGMLKDMMGNHAIDWVDLAEHYLNEIEAN